MTIQQAYQKLDLDGSENFGLVEKKYQELYNDAQIRLTNEFDEWRKSDLEKRIQDIKEAHLVLRQIPAAVVTQLPEYGYVLPELQPVRRTIVLPSVKPSKTHSSSSAAIAIAVTLHALLFFGLIWSHCEYSDNDLNTVVKKEQDTQMPTTTAEYKKDDNHAKKLNIKRKGTDKPKPRIPEQPLTAQEQKKQDFSNLFGKGKGH